MFNLDIKNTVNEINKIQEEITNIKLEINELINEKDNKIKRNEEKFKERYENVDKFEDELKSKFDNKFFNYIKHYDFLNEDELYEINEFEVVEELGCLTKRPKSINIVSGLDKTISTDRKSITYKIRDKKVINGIEYSFYSAKTKLPLVPRNIKINYEHYSDDFFENYFRYFNLNNQSTFISRYIFEPKMINEVVFYFDEEVILDNSLVNLLSIQYRTGNSLKIMIDNPKKIKTFNISKKSNEALISLNFNVSEDNLEFKPITFDKNNTGLINLEKGKQFVIEITSNDEKTKTKEKYEVKEAMEKSENIIEDGEYILKEKDINIQTIEIYFPTTSYNKIEKIFKEKEININNFIEFVAGVAHLKTKFIRNISEIQIEPSKLKFLDDISVVKNDESFFNVYYNKQSSRLITSDFLKDFNFFVKYQFKEMLPEIPDEYYTPILFEFSLKG